MVRKVLPTYFLLGTWHWARERFFSLHTIFIGATWFFVVGHRSLHDGVFIKVHMLAVFPLTPCAQLWQSKKSPDTDRELCVQMNFWLISFFPSFQTWSTKHRRRMSFGSIIIMRFHPIWFQWRGKKKKSLNWKNSGTRHRFKSYHPLIRRKSEQNYRITMSFLQRENENSTYFPYDFW